MTLFTSPQLVLFTRDIQRALDFYTALGFTEVFRVPSEGAPIHVDLELDGYRIGFATEETTRRDHGLDPVVSGQRAAVVLWTQDTPTAYGRLLELGAKPLQEPHHFLEQLMIAWAEDPDGHAIQVVQRR